MALQLRSTLAKNNLTIREAAKIAGCASSVFGAWLTGSFPGAESISALARFCRHFGVPLEMALVGDLGVEESESDLDEKGRFAQTVADNDQAREGAVFEGFAHIRIIRVFPFRDEHETKRQTKR